MSNVAIKFSHAGPSQGALPLAGRGRRIFVGCFGVILLFYGHFTRTFIGFFGASEPFLLGASTPKKKHKTC